MNIDDPDKLRSVRKQRDEIAQHLVDARGEIQKWWKIAMDRAERIAELEAALRSIAANTCCGPCQEAARVAASALETTCDHDWHANCIGDNYCPKCNKFVPFRSVPETGGGK